MSISSVASSTYAPPAPVAAAPPPAPPAADNDGDSDHGAPDVKAATPPGVGGNLDISA